MTVRQSAEQIFSADKIIMASHVRHVLNVHSIYKRTWEHADGTKFETTVRPDFPLLLGTNMVVTLEDVSTNKTQVKLDIKSQPYIMGDAFGFYDRYIRDFFSTLDKSVRDDSPVAIDSEMIILERSANWGSLLYAGGLLVFLYLIFFGIGFLPLGYVGWIVSIPFLVIALLAFIRAIRPFMRRK